MPKVSQAHIDARRDQILTAATRCFAQHGVRETTIARVCEEAGLSAGAVYRYFSSKQEILQAVYQRAMISNRAFGEQIAQSEDPVQTVRMLVLGMVGFIANKELEVEHHLSIQVHAAGLADPDLARAYSEVHRDVVSQVAPLIQSLQDAGTLPPEVDAEYLMWVLLTVYQGLRVQRMLDPSIDLERFAATLMQMVDATFGL